MNKVFNVNIITREGPLYEGRASSLVAPGEAGYLGVLVNHAPLITSLIPGTITIKNNPEAQIVIRSAGRGFMEVLKNTVTILLDSAGKEQPKGNRIAL